MNTSIRSKNYTVFVGNDPYYQIEKFLSGNVRRNDSKKFILVDDHTKEFCLPLILGSVPAFQHAEILEITNGESSKCIDTITKLWNELAFRGADRNSLLVNLGGGVVTDVGGFTASTYMRGIDFINIPTTLLAMVDASVGGKNGINFGGFKNRIGTFDEPRAVFASPAFLKTLPEIEIRCGFAEIIKHALITGPDKWRDIRAVENFEIINWFEVIGDSIRIKNKIVNSDYRDRHLRKALNFGHTIGHALESYSQKNHTRPLKHGEAIAIGMIGETFLSNQLCGLQSSDADDIYQFIRKHYSISADFESEAIVEIMKGDKKNSSDKINFALIRSIGDPVINQNTDEGMIRRALEFCKTQMMAVSDN